MNINGHDFQEVGAGEDFRAFRRLECPCGAFLYMAPWHTENDQFEGLTECARVVPVVLQHGTVSADARRERRARLRG